MSLQVKAIVVSLTTTKAEVRAKSEKGYHSISLTWVSGPATRDLPPTWWITAQEEIEEQRVLEQNPALKY